MKIVLLITSKYKLRIRQIKRLCRNRANNINPWGWHSHLVSHYFKPITLEHSNDKWDIEIAVTMWMINIIKSHVLQRFILRNAIILESNHEGPNLLNMMLIYLFLKIPLFIFSIIVAHLYIYEVSFLGEPQWQLQSSLSGWGNSIQVVGSLISQKQLFTSNHRPDIFVSNWKKCCYNKSDFFFTVFSYFGILLQQMFVPNVIFGCFKIFFCKAIW